MNNYQLFKGNKEIKAVNMDKFTAQDDVNEYLGKGLVSLGYVRADSSEQAIARIDFVSQRQCVSSEKNNSEAMPTFDSNYKTAQLVSSFISGFGWFIFACGIFGVLIAISADSGRYGFSMAQFFAAASPGFIGLISGLFLVASAQVMRATVDNADHSYQILAHLKKD